ncbi:MAG: nicotinamide riboside transporter PnuC [Pseudomonadota bacterium]
MTSESRFWSELLSNLSNMSGWELAAVIFALLYLVLAVRQVIWCWLAALISTSIYLVLFFEGKLYAESGLQVFYMVMAVYGWWQWRYGGAQKSELKVSLWSGRSHLVWLTVIAASTLALGNYLANQTDASLPFEDAFTTSGAIVATFMTARKVLENWYYWFVIDAVSIHLYLERGFVLTAALFVLYLVLIVIGFLSWRNDYVAQAHE